MGSIGEDYAEWKRRAEAAETRERETAQTRDEVVAAFEQQRRELKEALARAEQAERERDDARTLLDEAVRTSLVRQGELMEARRLHGKSILDGSAAVTRAERAEADNAALIDAFRDAFAAMTHMGDTLNDMDAVDEDEDAEAMAQCERATAFAALLVEQKAKGVAHPGAALLERLRALENLAAAGLKAFHGRMCSMSTGGYPTNPAECEDARCRTWARAVSGKGENA